MTRSRRGGRSGFTLVELLIVVAVIGIISAIAIPNLLDALRRAKQSRTMSDMRSIAQAVQTYAQDTSYFLPTSRITSAQLRPFLQPTYVEIVPATDGWSEPIYYEANHRSYTIVSLGANRTEDAPYPFGETSSSWMDIVLVDGTFVQWPEGAQND
jgi:general secretion pathway protein G